MQLANACQVISQLRERINQLILGQNELVTEVLCALMSSGHILITGVPGLAKTTLVRVLSNQLGLAFSRIQFTPDLLPSDILGTEILDFDSLTQQRHFRFVQGPIFSNLVLADEINRASPRTQAAMLEAMQEKSVTINGKKNNLDNPFMVLATQNPIETEGTFPLPEAQMDRFIIHSHIHYPNKEAELNILRAHGKNELVGEKNHDEKENKITQQDVRAFIFLSSNIHIDDILLEAINSLVRMTRPEDISCPKEFKESLWYGAGPRGSLSLISASKSHALMENRDRVTWFDIKRMIKPTLRHRLKLSIEAHKDLLTEDGLLDQIIKRIEDHYSLNK